MMQPPLLGFGPATNALPQWLGSGAPPATAAGQNPSGAVAGDGVARPWWANATSANGVCPDGFGNGAGGSTLTGLLGGLLGVLQQLLGSLTGSAGNGYGAGGYGGGCAPGGYAGGTGYGGGVGNGPPQWLPPYQVSPQQRVGDMEITSTGDPHIGESGTVLGRNGAATQVSQKYDSMAAQPDLVDSAWIAGGYKVSTTVTQPNANGVTYNQTATVTANDGLDDVTMNRNGSYTVVDAGSQVQLAKGKSLTLSGGETVTANADGSLTVAATNGQGGSISTVLKANGTELNVETHAHDIALGGEVMNRGRLKTPQAP